jgi:uncharacterized OB-fold protein
VTESPKSTGRAAAPDMAMMAGPVAELVAGAKPVVIAETRGFWEGTANQELRVQRCANGHVQLPGGPCCRVCLSPELSWEPATGRGTVFSFTVVHHALHPQFMAQIPYVLADVQLEEGPVLTSNVTDISPDDVEIGMPVEVWFDEPGADAFGTAFRLPKFRPSGGG